MNIIKRMIIFNYDTVSWKKNKTHTYTHSHKCTWTVIYLLYSSHSLQPFSLPNIWRCQSDHCKQLSWELSHHPYVNIIIEWDTLQDSTNNSDVRNILSYHIISCHVMFWCPNIISSYRNPNNMINNILSNRSKKWLTVTESEKD